MKSFWMLVRREFWEHRMLWITPLAIAGLILVTTVGFGRHMHLEVGSISLEGQSSALQAAGADEGIAMAAVALSTPFYIAASFLAVIYLLDCLYADRRDRSVLFWRSLPIADHTLVLSKLTVGLVLIPLGAVLAAAGTTLLVAAVLAIMHGIGLGGMAPALWSAASWLRAQEIMLFAAAASILWYAPYAGYLLMISALARRSVYALAFIPPVLLAIMEKVLLGTNYVGHVVQRGFGEMLGLAFKVEGQINRTLGSWRPGMPGGPADLPGPGGPGPGLGGHGPGGHSHLQELVLRPDLLLSNTHLLIGLAVAALFVYAAIWLRRRSDAI